ncbi:MAG: hypothetical protein HBSAPP04_01220 [Ignavibacteriaceae bacterium]|nr:MAG: hypothetical protein HBSAPP04_01220 [Ignavibacteriaceae bacterium]
MENPVSDYGKIVTGARFIGRFKEISIIQNRIKGKNFGNLSITGLPRIGKSSLAYNAVYLWKKEWLKEKKIVIWINIGKFKSSLIFYQKLVLDALNEIELIDPDLFNNLSKVKDNIYDPLNSEVEFITYFQRFFRLFYASNYHLICILDEFDNAERIFDTEDFQLLRELSSDPTSQICLITLSRRTLQELERKNSALSNFYQIFTELQLGFYSKEDEKRYWEFIKSHGLVLETEAIIRIKSFTATHPFLLDVVLNEVFIYMSSKIDTMGDVLSAILDDLRVRMYNEYSSIISLMEEEKLSSKLVQAIVGPLFDIRQIDIDRLLKYQLVKDEGDHLIGFSEYFNDFVRLIQTNIEVWPLWAETESELRNLVKHYLDKKYGEEWEQKFLSQHKMKYRFIDNYKAMRQRNSQQFGERASMHLVDYTYPFDCYACFFTTDWQYFVKVFKKTTTEWSVVFTHLAKIRNPLAHNNPNFLSDSDREVATGYCKEILLLINNWKMATKTFW